MRILLVQPPVAAPAGPSAAVARLAGSLKARGHAVAVADANLALTMRVLSRDGVRDVARAATGDSDVRARHLRAHADGYADTIEMAVRCLQGRDAGAIALCGRRGYLPPPADPYGADAGLRDRYLEVLTQELGALTPDQRLTAASIDPFRMAFGVSADRDRAQGAARLVVEDVMAAARCASASALLDAWVDTIGDTLAARHQPDVVAFIAPDGAGRSFAQRIAARLTRADPSMTIVFGGPGDDDGAAAWLFDAPASDDIAPDYADFPLSEYFESGWPTGQAALASPR